MGSMAEPSAISQRDLLNIEIHDGHPVLLGARLVPPRGPNPVSKKWALRLCLRDRRHKGRHAGFGPGTACACVRAHVAESDLRVFSSRSRARSDGNQYQCRRSHETDRVGRTLLAVAVLGAADPEARWGGTVKQPEAGVPIG